MESISSEDVGARRIIFDHILVIAGVTAMRALACTRLFFDNFSIKDHNWAPTKNKHTSHRPFVVRTANAVKAKTEAECD